jgi:hypothetical protein
MRLTPFILAGLSLLCVSVAAADTVIVDLDGILSPLTTIQDGLDFVMDGGTVYVCPGRSGRGIYRGPRNRDLTFWDKNISLETFAAGPGEVVIDCEGLDRAFNLSASVDSTSRILGFTVVNGATTGDGGAIRAAGSLPVIEQCIFRSNSAANGGAIWTAGGQARIRGCDFFDNTATSEGGAVHLNSSDAAIRSSLFHGNTAADLGAVAVVGSDPQVTSCSFAMNGGGSAACVGIDGSGGVIERCVLAFSLLGASVSAPSPEIYHCCVFGNQGGDGLPGDVHDCIYVDPLLCGLYAGELSLCQNSSCLITGNIWKVQIGARAQGCGECDSPVAPSSWGAVKALFR